MFTVTDKKKIGVVRFVGLCVLAALLLFLSAPIARWFGQPELAVFGMYTGLSVLAVALSHPLRKMLFPYLDLQALAKKADDSPVGSGLVFLGVCFVLGCIVLMMGGAAHAETLPAGTLKSKMYIPILEEEAKTYFPDVPLKSALAAQVEQETCTSLSSPRCWSPYAELKTSLEQGVGLGQITRTSRFDSLAELKTQYGVALKEWAWDNKSLYDPRYQLRGLVLMDARNWNVIQVTDNAFDRIAMAFAAYNGGLGGLSADRAMCRGTKGCDQTKWFGHVELTSKKSRVANSGYGQSAFDINRGYVRNIMVVRRVRYKYMDQD